MITKLLDIAFSGFWPFIGVFILVYVVLFFGVNGMVRIFKYWFKSITSIVNTPPQIYEQPPLWHTETNTTTTPDLSKVTRFEVIDHSLPYTEAGRVYTKRDIEKLEFSVQDEGRTLKVFISKNNEHI